MIAKAIIISNILYVITVYGSCSEYLLTLLQVIQNTAARCVTGLGWKTKVSVLLRQCGWLSVWHMVVYHSMVQLYKIKTLEKPSYLHSKISTNFQKRTRLAEGNGIREVQRIKTYERRKTFLPRATRVWNSLPVAMRNIQNLNKFKREMKTYVMANVNLI